MLVLFASSFKKEHGGALLLSEYLVRVGVRHLMVNPHKLAEDGVGLCQKQGSIKMRYRDSLYTPSAFFFLNNWRTDAIISMPSSIKYPALLRLRAQQLLQDIRFAFEECEWFPGHLEDIERADSKPCLMREAYLLGLEVPAFTCDLRSEEMHKEQTGSVYRKSLGTAFSISLNRETGREVGVTTVGVRFENLRLPDGQFWQWQELIAVRAQIRCCVIQDRLWAVRWNRTASDQSSDYRLESQIRGKKIEWLHYELPGATAAKTIELARRLKLSYGAPEFLEDEQGRLIFVDMNPCGDWYGFFSETVEAEIVQKFLSLIQEKM